MACSRCKADGPTGRDGWCAACERAYDTWLRPYATDIIVPVLTGMVVITAVAVVLPFLGAGSLIAYGGVFAGFATLFGMFRLRRRQRKRQFLTTSLPRAYLPSKT